MKKKILFILLLLIMPVMLLCGCSYETSPRPALESGNRFVITKERTTGNTVYVEMYDKSTKVMYIYVKLSESGSLTMLVNSDGTPMLWEGEL